MAAVYKTTQTSASIDRYRNGGYAALTLVLLPGAWTDGSHAFAINESDDNSTFTAVAAADILPGSEVGVYGTATTFVSITAATTTVQRIDYIGRKRYVQVVCRVCGVSFQFLGLPGGLHPDYPTVSVDGTEARLPIAPYEVRHG